MRAHSYSPASANRDILGELLHSVSQPLTTLRCSLELSLDEAAEQQRQTVAAALEQTENAIGIIQLMREYLDAEQGGAKGPAIAMMPVLRSLCDELSPLAAARDVRLRLVGTCTSKLSIGEPWLRKALEYLISATIERQPPGSEITLLLGEGPAGAVLRFEGERGLGLGPSASERFVSEPKLGSPQPARGSIRATMQRVRLAIAARVLESAGVVVALDDNAVLRIPRLGRSAT
jgi:signal transduction histidine kinase